MNILLFGKGGQVGWEQQRSLAVLGTVTALDHDSADHCGDFANPAGVAETVRALRPDVIVNAAAHTAVDKAESEADLARTLNATTPGAIAQEAAKLGAWLVHYSTDYVFDGSGQRPWKESDATGPLSVYGRTKLEGEQAVARCAQHLVLRTSWVYAARGGNFAKTMLRLAAERTQLSVIDDQFGAPTSAEFLAQATLTALQSKIEGLYHVAARGETSWYDYARFIIPEYTNIEPILDTDLNLPARRPRNSRLNTEKFEWVFGITPPLWPDDVRRYLKGSKA